MGKERDKEQDQATELDNAEATELEEKDLEDASGGQTPGNFNCGC